MIVTSFRALSAVLLLTLAVSSQAPAGASPQPTRRAHPGRVLDAAGEPVAGASVTFLAVTDAFGDGADLAKGRAGADGRFRVDLLPGSRYRVFASAPAGSRRAGAPAVTSLEYCVGVTTELRFGAGPAQPPAEVVSIGGLEAWKGRGAVRAEVWLAGYRQAVSEEFEGRPGFAMEVPPLPLRDVEVRVFVGGKMVHQARGVGEVRLPPPLVCRARVLAHGSDAPIAGANIYRVWNADEWTDQTPEPLQPGCRRELVATTGAGGFAEWLMATERGPFAAGDHGAVGFYVATADGYQSHWKALVLGPGQPGKGALREDWAAADEGAEARRVTTFHLSVFASLEVVVEGDVPVRGAGWAAMMDLWESQAPNAIVYDARVVERAADGRITIPRWPIESRHRRLFLIGVTPDLAPDDPFRSALAQRPVEVFAIAPREEPLRIDVSKVVPVRAELQNSLGNPAAGVDVYLIPRWGREERPWGPYFHPVHTDTAGRLAVPAMPEDYMLVAVGAREWATCDVSVRAGMSPLVVRMQAMPTMDLLVLDVEGWPVAGAFARFSPADAENEVSSREKLLTALVPLAADHGRSLQSMSRSGADGRLSLPFVPVEGLKRSFRVYSRDLDGPSSALVVLKETEEGKMVFVN